MNEIELFGMSFIVQHQSLECMSKFHSIYRSVMTSPVMNSHTEKYRIDSEIIEPLHPSNTQNSSLFFADDRRSIDFILIWKANDDRTQEDSNHVTKRAIFEENLINEGLELERESDEELNFIKIHTPIEYSDILKLRMPRKLVNMLVFSQSLCFQFEQENCFFNSLFRSPVFVLFSQQKLQYLTH